jgi:hypothetical protein
MEAKEYIHLHIHNLSLHNFNYQILEPLYIWQRAEWSNARSFHSHITRSHNHSPFQITLSSQDSDWMHCCVKIETLCRTILTFLHQQR